MPLTISQPAEFNNVLNSNRIIELRKSTYYKMTKYSHTRSLASDSRATDSPHHHTLRCRHHPLLRRVAIRGGQHAQALNGILLLVTRARAHRCLCRLSPSRARGSGRVDRAQIPKPDGAIEAAAYQHAQTIKQPQAGHGVVVSD